MINVIKMDLYRMVIAIRLPFKIYKQMVMK